MAAETRWRGRFIEAITEGRWEYVRRVKGQGAAVIYAVTDAGELVLVEQYRVPLGRPAIELPAGIVGDETGLSDEGPLAAAARELEEETGFRAQTLVAVGDYVTTPGLASEEFTLVRASGLERVGPGGGVAGEDITVHLVPLDELAAFLRAAATRGAAIDKVLAGLVLAAM